MVLQSSGCGMDVKCEALMCWLGHYAENTEYTSCLEVGHACAKNMAGLLCWPFVEGVLVLPSWPWLARGRQKIQLGLALHMGRSRGRKKQHVKSSSLMMGATAFAWGKKTCT